MDLENKALDYDLTLKRKRIMIYFIEATEKLLRRHFQMSRNCDGGGLQQRNDL